MAKKGPEPVGNSALIYKLWTVLVMPSCLWLGHPSLWGGVDIGRLYTTLADFNVGLVSDGRWQRRRCICTRQSAIGGARRTPFPLIVAIHRVAVEGREGSD